MFQDARQSLLRAACVQCHAPAASSSCTVGASRGRPRARRPGPTPACAAPRALCCSYYGESQPFGASSPQYPFYLTHEQALADYAALIFYLQTSVLGAVQPVIAFGGSYGGKLSAWMRMSYPGVIAGAVAASAPVLAFDGVSPAFDSQAYWAVVTRDLGRAAQCQGVVGFKAQ